jgi:hypothetical protein
VATESRRSNYERRCEFPESSTQDEIRTAVEGVARELTGGGARVEASMPDVDLRHQYELGEELSDLLAFTFSADPSVFSEEGSATSWDAEHSPLEAYLVALDRRDEVMRTCGKSPSPTGTPSWCQRGPTRPNGTVRSQVSHRRWIILMPSLRSRAVRWLSSPQGATAKDCPSACKSQAAAGTTSGSWWSPNFFRNLHLGFSARPTIERVAQFM